MSFSNSDSLQLVDTKDGSQTVLNTTSGSTYHSRHGAVTESKHVFIDKGLRLVLDKEVTEITLLEMGFGTGLNALLTFMHSDVAKVNVNYHALELFPLSESIWKEYQLPVELKKTEEMFAAIHSNNWNETFKISEFGSLTKHHISILDFEPRVSFDLVYYDAFEPETQPELWTAEVFQKLFSWLKAGGILTTYCCKGYVRRNMIAAGFEVTKVSGPPGKREMICAKKPL